MPEGVPPTSEEKARLHQQKCDARLQAAVDYGNAEVTFAIHDGPFRIQMLLASGDVADVVRQAASRLSGAWMFLSHPRLGHLKSHHAEMLKERDNAYVALGLCKALVLYPRDLHRRAPGEQNPRPGFAPGFAARIEVEVAPHLKARTYEQSITQNETFRRTFNRFVDELRKVKSAHDPDDRLHDYRTDPAYRAAVDRVVAEFFPPRCTRLSLIDGLSDFRTRLRFRITGPAKGRTTPQEMFELNEEAGYFAFIADGVGLLEAPPLPPFMPLHGLYEYATELLRAARPAQLTSAPPPGGSLAVTLAADAPPPAEVMVLPRVPDPADGPVEWIEAPRTYWFKDKRCHVPRDQLVHLLNFFIGRERAGVEEVMCRGGPVVTWREKYSPRNANQRNKIKTGISRLNGLLEQAAIPIKFRLDGGYIIKTVTG